MLRKEAINPQPVAAKGLHDLQMIHFIPFLHVQSTQYDDGGLDCLLQ